MTNSRYTYYFICYYDIPLIKFRFYFAQMNSLVVIFKIKITFFYYYYLILNLNINLIPRNNGIYSMLNFVDI